MKEKRLLGFLLTALFCSLFSASLLASPAPRWPYKVKLPDGTTITVKTTGDEFFRYTTTTDGYNVVLAEDGYYYYAEDAGGKLVSTGVRAKDPARRTAVDRAALSRVHVGAPAWAFSASKASPLRQGRAEAERRSSPSVKTMKKAAISSGEPYKSLVLLVNFKDVKFTTPSPQQAFTDLLNQKDYSYDGSTGSAAQYFNENSNDRFDPQFDVYGPYTISQNSSWYANNEYRWRTMALEAVTLANPDVDFSQYADGNEARGIYIFFAGQVQGSGTIWPHQWYFDEQYFDGVYLSQYACSGEFETYSTSTRARIGTFCHEFGHVIGWPDFYDTDYSSNGQSVAVEYYSLMDYGCYTNEGRTPPAFNAMERMLQGWLTPKEFAYTSQYTLKPVAEDDAYIINTGTNNEFFLVENRSATDSKGPNVWEQKLAEELNITMPLMMVYHVDMSNNYISRWSNNTINCYSSHECFKVVRANTGNVRNWGYPGPSNVTTLSSSTSSEFKPWSGGNMVEVFTSIARSGNNITFNLDNGSSPPVEITLNNSEVELFRGETVQLSATVDPSEHTSSLVWSSSNSAVATVSAGGLVTAISTGQAVIYAEVMGVKAECKVTVNNYVVKLDKSSIELYLGGTDRLHATIAPDAPGAVIEWSSSNATVATVSDSGLVTAVATGDAVITAKMRGEDSSAKCSVKVLKPDASVVVDAVHQNDVWVYWTHSNPEYKGNFHMTVKHEGDLVASVSSPEAWAYAGLLTPGTTYSVNIYLDNNGAAGGQIGGLAFKTPEAADFPASIGFTSPDDEGRTTLYLQNVGEVSSVKWALDGNEIAHPRFEAAAPGRYTVTAEYQSAEYGETITKVITIK